LEICSGGQRTTPPPVYLKEQAEILRGFWVAPSALGGDSKTYVFPACYATQYNYAKNTKNELYLLTSDFGAVVVPDHS